MDTITNLLSITMGAILVNNFIFSQFLGCCPFLGVSKKVDTAVLLVMCIIREFLGAGTFGGGILNGGDGIRILPEQFPIGMLTLPVGGFLVLACLIAAMQWALSKSKNKEESK